MAGFYAPSSHRQVSNHLTLFTESFPPDSNEQSSSYTPVLSRGNRNRCPIPGILYNTNTLEGFQALDKQSLLKTEAKKVFFSFWIMVMFCCLFFPLPSHVMFELILNMKNSSWTLLSSHFNFLWNIRYGRIFPRAKSRRIAAFYQDSLSFHLLTWKNGASIIGLLSLHWFLTLLQLWLILNRLLVGLVRKRCFKYQNDGITVSFFGDIKFDIEDDIVFVGRVCDSCL